MPNLRTKQELKDAIAKNLPLCHTPYGTLHYDEDYNRMIYVTVYGHWFDLDRTPMRELDIIYRQTTFSNYVKLN